MAAAKTLSQPTVGMPFPFQLEAQTKGHAVDEDAKMFNDICTTPDSLRAVLRKYLTDSKKLHFPTLTTPLISGHFAGKSPMELLAACKQGEDGSFGNRIIMVGGGTSLNASLTAEYLIEQIARVPVEVHYASEYCHKKPIFREGDILVCVTSSGETDDVIRSLRKARDSAVGSKILTLAVVNDVESTVARECDAFIDVQGGDENGVTSTKVFSATIFTLALFALSLGQACGALEAQEQAELLETAMTVPDLVAKVIRNELQDGECRLWDIACHNVLSQNLIFLGRGFNFPIALEGATKCKEVAYIHAEGYPAAEMKHGPIALIDQFMPVVVICPPSDPCYHKIISNLQEVKTRSGCIIAVTEEGNDELVRDCGAENVIMVPPTHEYFTPIVNAIPLQLLACMMGMLRGNNVTMPRGLTKRTSSALSMGGA
jgi:glucosamine--fructose-6-phosphate aminotransferase (isomerizing)